MRLSPDQAQKIAEDLSLRLERSKTPVPIGVSNRHLHLTQEHWDALFGKGSQPKKYRPTRQPGYYAAEQAVDVEGPKGKIVNVRVVAPHRTKTQVEVSRTDALALGLNPPVRGSGTLTGAAPIKITGPKGSVDVPDALIIAQRHVHFSPAEAAAMKVKDGEFLRVRAGVGGPRETVFEGALARVSDKFALEFHIDTDEANAAWVKNGDLAYIV
ncbi:MAG TPA: phosphate propanoyltransferase [Elusimicrobiota bacterium]|nr:phosphate propanoyltransferase [Elusimicrobiota bacterium]